jgi:hypothetical protein
MRTRIRHTCLSKQEGNFVIFSFFCSIFKFWAPTQLNLNPTGSATLPSSHLDMPVQVLLAKGESGQASNLGNIQDDTPGLKTPIKRA